MEPSRAVKLLAATPTKPGVYTMKDAAGSVLYVGKASNLRNRLRSYFGAPADLSIKVLEMMPRVEEFEYIVTASEAEALLLENNLIKRHKPRFNIRLKDDKNYPYIKVTLQEDWPRLDITRRVSQDGARYFGPFASASSMRKTMALLKRLFPYRSCTKAITGTDPRPCLEYHIHRCVAPCVGFVTKEQYRQVIDQVCLFLDGKQDTVLRQLRLDMQAASDAEAFERAALVRDQIQAIERVAQEQKAVSLERQDQDVIAVAQDGDEALVEAFFIRQGKLIGRESFLLEGARGEAPATVLGEFAAQYYATAAQVPPEILLQHEPADVEALRALASARRGKLVAIKTPVRGDRKKLMEMVAANAREGLQRRRVQWMADREKVAGALGDLQEHLSLRAPPRRMETYDISNIHGQSAVGSMVVFVNGEPRPREYRRFRIKGVEQIDDYAMMREMLRRRFARLGRKAGDAFTPGAGSEAAATEGFGVVPDLVLIDGGKGHLNAALEVLLGLGLGDLPLASIAKREEEVYIPDMDEPVPLPRRSQALYLVQRMRDEAHRFAITYHRAVRSRASVRSALDDVSGIGPWRKKALLGRFGSVQAIRDAPVDELATVMGMTRSLAERLKEKL
ncbi:MAG: excinuclease ABC subunit UvrC [Dehalococcoidia bacterium]|nr:excinuclease ABC subunit UvrC [Dehalococcoidia bacterium]